MTIVFQYTNEKREKNEIDNTQMAAIIRYLFPTITLIGGF